MIRYKDTIFPDYFIDPITATITNSKGEIQKIKNGKDGRPYFKGMSIHQIQIHTHIGYKKGYDIHHLDENKFNNSLSNLVYLTHSEHTIIHKKGKGRSEETKRKMSESKKGNKNMLGKHHTEDVKRKISDSFKDRIWINNGVVNKFVKINSEIPEGFIRGRLKWKK